MRIDEYEGRTRVKFDRVFCYRNNIQIEKPSVRQAKMDKADTVPKALTDDSPMTDREPLANLDVNLPVVSKKRAALETKKQARQNTKKTAVKRDDQDEETEIEDDEFELDATASTKHSSNMGKRSSLASLDVNLPVVSKKRAAPRTKKQARQNTKKTAVKRDDEDEETEMDDDEFELLDTEHPTRNNSNVSGRLSFGRAAKKSNSASLGSLPQTSMQFLTKTSMSRIQERLRSRERQRSRVWTERMAQYLPTCCTR